MAGKKTKTLEERFWAKVDKRGPDECWPWTGARGPKGYGAFSINNRARLATRTSMALHLGSSDPLVGLFVCHRCDNPPCVNPAHLFLGTLQDNNRDMAAKGRGKNPVMYGEAHPQAKLSQADVDDIRSSAESRAVVAARLGVSASAVKKIRSGKTWKASRGSLSLGQPHLSTMSSTPRAAVEGASAGTRP